MWIELDETFPTKCFKVKVKVTVLQKFGIANSRSVSSQNMDHGWELIGDAETGDIDFLYTWLFEDMYYIEMFFISFWGWTDFSLM